MNSNDSLRLKIQKILSSKGLLDKKKIEKGIWNAEMQNAWDSLCFSTLGMRFYAKKIPSYSSLNEDVIAKLSAMEEKPAEVKKENAPANNEGKEKPEAKTKPENKENKKKDKKENAPVIEQEQKI